jgi:hypothetical protein
MKRDLRGTESKLIVAVMDRRERHEIRVKKALLYQLARAALVGYRPDARDV